MSESLEKAFWAYYRKEKRRAFILSIVYGCSLLVILALHFVLHLPLSRWWIIFAVLLILPWTRVAVTKHRINKKWFVTNEYKAREFIAYATGKKKQHFFNFIFILFFTGLAIACFGLYELQSLTVVIIGVIIMLSAPLIVTLRAASPLLVLKKQSKP